MEKQNVEMGFIFANGLPSFLHPSGIQHIGFTPVEIAKKREVVMVRIGHTIISFRDLNEENYGTDMRTYKRVLGSFISTRDRLRHQQQHAGLLVDCQCAQSL